MVDCFLKQSLLVNQSWFFKKSFHCNFSYLISHVKWKLRYIGVMKSIKQYNLGGCSAGGTDERDLWGTPLKMASGGMIYTPSLMKIDLGIQELQPRQFQRLYCWYYKCIPSDSLRWQDILTKSHDDRFRHSSSINSKTSTLSEAIVLVLLTRGIYDARHSRDFKFYTYQTSWRLAHACEQY
jgi:hypothetical protein